MNFKEYCDSLEAKIISGYEDGLTPDIAEKLSGEFLVAQLKVSRELKNGDMDTRMKKAGLKAIRANAYLDILSKNDKKPTEAAITSLIDTDGHVSTLQDAFDTAEVNKADLERVYNVFVNAHIFYRGVSKGRFE